MKNRTEASAEKLITNKVLEKPLMHLNSGLYHKVAIGGGKRCDIGSM